MGKNSPTMGSGKLPLSRPGLSRRGNAIVVGLLILLTLLYFTWQVRQNTRLFSEHASQQSRMLADILRLNTTNSLLTEELLTTTAQRFLTNTAEFIAYLNRVEPFNADELAAFADKAGLAGIRITQDTSGGDATRTVEGPPGWLGSTPLSAEPFQHLPAKHLFVLTRADADAHTTLRVGFAAGFMEEFKQRSGLAAMLASLEKLPEIRAVRLEEMPHAETPEPSGDIRIDMFPDEELVVVSLPLGNSRLVVRQDAGHYFDRVRRLWQEFALFSIVIAMAGIFFSWLLSRFQQVRLDEIQAAERQLAQQHEDATIGRAAATISHEIKNPLNAIGMGLQRLQMEVPALSREQGELLASMLLAVNRTSNIITGLKQYAQPISPNPQSVIPGELVEASLILYKEACQRHGIRIDYQTDFPGAIAADPCLLGQVIENLLKNAIEAQPDGGSIAIHLGREHNQFQLTMTNPGFTVPVTELHAILEPYFTRKTTGTGLGLTISRRIVQAHGGTLSLDSPADGVLRVTVTLPVAAA